jgi:putative ABC transport system permease protein
MMLVPGETPPMPDPSKDLAAFERWSCRPYAGTVARELGQALPGATVRPVSDLVRGEGRVVGRLNLLMVLLTGAALAAAALGVMSTMVASVVDGTHEIALLRALGATRSGVGGLFAGEILLVAVIGGVLGAFLGFALAQLIGRGAFGVAVPPQPLLVPAAVALAALVCTAGAWFPLRRISAIDPARALRPGA